MGMQVGEIFANLKLNNTDFNSKLKASEAKLKNFGKTVNTGVSKPLKGAGDDTEKLGDKLKGTGKSAEQMGNQTQGAGKQVDESRRYFNKAELGLVSLGVALTTVGRQMDNLIAKPFINFMKDSIKVGSSMEEAINRVGVVFGNSADEIERFARNLQDVGISASTGLEYITRFGTYLKGPGGLTGGELEKTSKEMTQLLGDLSSFFDLDMETTANALMGVLNKQTKTTRKLAIDPTVGNLQEYMEQMNIEGKYSNLSQDEQLRIRVDYLFTGVEDAMGDFKRTADSVANIQKSISEIMKDIKASFFDVFKDELKKILKMVRDFLKWLRDSPDIVKKILISFGALATVLTKIMVIVGPIALAWGMIASASSAIGAYFTNAIVGISKILGTTKSLVFRGKEMVLLNGTIKSTLGFIFKWVSIILVVVVSIYKQWDLFVKVISKSIKRMKRLFKEASSGVLAKQFKNFSIAMAVILDIIEKIIAVLAGALLVVIIEIVNLVLYLVTLWSDLQEKLRTSSELSDNILQTFNLWLNPLAFVSELVQTIADLLNGEWVTAMDELNSATLIFRTGLLMVIYYLLVGYEILVDMWNKIKSFFEPMISSLSKFWTKYKLFAIESEYIMKSVIAKIVFNTKIAIMEIVSEIKTRLPNAFNKVMNEVKKKYNSMVTAMGAIGGKLGLNKIALTSTTAVAGGVDSAKIQAEKDKLANLLQGLKLDKLWGMGGVYSSQYGTGATTGVKTDYANWSEKVINKLKDLGLWDVLNNIEDNTKDTADKTEKVANNTEKDVTGFFLDKMFGVIEKGSGFGMDTVQVKEDLKQIVRSEVRIGVDVNGRIDGANLDKIGSRIIKSIDK